MQDHLYFENRALPSAGLHADGSCSASGLGAVLSPLLITVVTQEVVVKPGSHQALPLRKGFADPGLWRSPGHPPLLLSHTFP